jgi:GNAT superfamily N-acetyltransferase
MAVRRTAQPKHPNQVKPRHFKSQFPGTHQIARYNRATRSYNYTPSGRTNKSAEGTFKMGEAYQDISHHDAVWSASDLPEHLRAEGYRGHTHLNIIHVAPKNRGKGHGQKAFERMTKWADENNRVLSLSACHFEMGHDDTPHKVVDGKHVKNFLHTHELEKFYKKHGFRKNKNDGDMYRAPRLSFADAVARTKKLEGLAAKATRVAAKAVK